MYWHTRWPAGLTRSSPARKHVWEGHFKYNEVGKREAVSSPKRMVWWKSLKSGLLQDFKWEKYSWRCYKLLLSKDTDLFLIATLWRRQHLNGWNFWEVNQKWSRMDQAWCCRGDHEMTLRIWFFTSSMWFICWFNRSRWSSCVTTTNLSQSSSDLSIIIRIAILQWRLNFSILFLWEPKPMLFISYISSARPTKMRKNVNKLVRTDKRIDVSYFWFFCWLKLQFLEWIVCLKQKMLCQLSKVS